MPIWTYVYIPYRHKHKRTHTHKNRWDDSPSNYANHPLSSCCGWQLTNCVTYVTLTKPRAVDKQGNPSLSLSWPPTLWLSDLVSLARCHQRGSCYCITCWEQVQDCLQETQEPKSVVPAPICTASAASTSPFRCLPSLFTVYPYVLCSESGTGCMHIPRLAFYMGIRTWTQILKLACQSLFSLSSHPSQFLEI